MTKTPSPASGTPRGRSSPDSSSAGLSPSRGARRQPRSAPDSALWAVTVVGGMLLRAVTGQGVVPAFVIVASIVLFLFLVGWRLIAALVRRRRMPRPAASTLEP